MKKKMMDERDQSKRPSGMISDVEKAKARVEKKQKQYMMDK